MSRPVAGSTTVWVPSAVPSRDVLGPWGEPAGDLRRGMAAVVPLLHHVLLGCARLLLVRLRRLLSLRVRGFRPG